MGFNPVLLPVDSRESKTINMAFGEELLFKSSVTDEGTIIKVVEGDPVYDDYSGVQIEDESGNYAAHFLNWDSIGSSNATPLAYFQGIMLAPEETGSSKPGTISLYAIDNIGTIPEPIYSRVYQGRIRASAGDINIEATDETNGSVNLQSDFQIRMEAKGGSGDPYGIFTPDGLISLASGIVGSNETLGNYIDMGYAGNIRFLLNGINSAPVLYLDEIGQGVEFRTFNATANDVATRFRISNTDDSAYDGFDVYSENTLITSFYGSNEPGLKDAWGGLNDIKGDGSQQFYCNNYMPWTNDSVVLQGFAVDDAVDPPNVGVYLGNYNAFPTNGGKLVSFGYGDIVWSAYTNHRFENWAEVAYLDDDGFMVPDGIAHKYVAQVDTAPTPRTNETILWYDANANASAGGWYIVADFNGTVKQIELT